MFKKICNGLTGIILTVLLVIAAVLILPRALGFQEFAVLSGSMEPTIHVGAICYDRSVDFEDIEVGDVVTYQLDDGTRVTHRVITVNDDQTVITQGDANDAEDASPVSADQIVGTVAFSIPYLGYITIYGHSQLGIAAICGIIALLLILNFLPDILTEGPKDREEEKIS